MFFGFAGIGCIYIGDVASGLLELFFGWFTHGIWPLIDLFLMSGAAETSTEWCSLGFAHG